MFLFPRRIIYIYIYSLYNVNFSFFVYLFFKTTMLAKKRNLSEKLVIRMEGSVRSHEQKKKKKRVLNRDQDIFSAIYILHLFIFLTVMYSYKTDMKVNTDL